jgi:hypothetical protein
VYNNSAFIANKITIANAKGKIAIRHTPSGVKVYIDGVDRTKSGATQSANLSQKIDFTVSVGASTNFMNLNNIMYFPTALTDAQLIELTTI